MTTRHQAALFTDAFHTDPHPTYAMLRRDEPVRRIVLPTGVPVWLISRYDDAREALGDARLSKAQSEAGRLERLPGPIHNALSRHMLATDPPDHTRLRRLVSRVFTARRTESLRPRVQQITDRLLDGIVADRVDLIDAFAFPLPIQVICELVGIPVEDRDTFRAWSNVIVSGGTGASVSRTVAITTTPRTTSLDLPTAAASMVEYIRDLLARKQARPADDLLSGLLAAHDAGDRLTRDELISMVFLLLVAGHETTVNLIGNAVFLLCGRPEHKQRLLANPSLLPSAVEEFLRYESPVETATLRVATEPVTYGGTTIPAGDAVLVSLLSANRDADRFREPDELDLGRRDNPHLAFGHGIHYCLGAPLARLEAQVGLGSLLRRFPHVRLAVEPDELIWRPGLLLRGLLSLPVQLNRPRSHRATAGRDT